MVGPVFFCFHDSISTVRLTVPLEKTWRSACSWCGLTSVTKTTKNGFKITVETAIKAGMADKGGTYSSIIVNEEKNNLTTE